MGFSARLGVTNDDKRKQARVIYVEPSGRDYTLLPGDSLEIIAYDDADVPWFNVIENEDSIQVYCEDTSSFVVTQDGMPIECGHKRGATPA